MDATLNVITKIQGFTDSTVNSNPRLMTVSWQRDISGQPVADPKTDTYSIVPSGSQLVFDGTQATTIDGTTTFDLTLSPLDPSRYRIEYASGTAPGFRTARNLTLSGLTVTFVVNTNATATVTTTGSFAAVQVGDEIFIPHTTTGDSASPFNSLNVGYWSVLAKNSPTQLTLVRDTGETFEAYAEVVTVTANSQFRAYSTTGVQVGYSVDITGGFAAGTRQTFVLEAVTDTFLEFISTIPLAPEDGIAPNTGITFYTNAKVFVYVESDQNVAVRVNGDTGNYQRVSPPDASNPEHPGQYMRRGTTWSLTIVNLTTSTANVFVVHAGT